MAAWQIRADRDAGWADAFIAEGRVGMGDYRFPISITEFQTLDDLKRRLGDDIDPYEGPQGRGQLASQMWRMLHEVQIGDWVVMPSKPRRREYVIGRIVGHYEMGLELVAGYALHTRPVQWLKTGIPGERMASLRLPTRGTINRLRSDGVEERIEALLD